MAIMFSTRIGAAPAATASFASMRFPAGEAHVKVVADRQGEAGVIEIARITGADANDLMLLAMWADACRQRGARTAAFIPYLPGARQDRGIPFGAKVYADFINSMAIDQLVCFDPHSPVMPGLLRNLTVIDSAPLVREHVVAPGGADVNPAGSTPRDGAPAGSGHGGGNQAGGELGANATAPMLRYTGIIAPDHGAVERAGRVARACGLPLYRAEKHRDPGTGELSGFSCEALPEDGAYLVVDDICDGGGTFMGLANAIGIPAERLGLWVSHGVFSGSAHALAEHFGEIWTTDSFPQAAGWPSEHLAKLHTIELDPHLTGALA